MEGAEVLHPYHFIELLQSRPESFFTSKVIAGRERMACIQTDTDAGFVVDERDDVAEVFERRADDVAGASHVFDEGFDGFGGGVGAVERFGYAGNGGGAGRGACGARAGED